jgi:hypothetical protein
VPDDPASSPSAAARLSIPRWTATPRELDDLELLVNGSFSPPLDGFVDPADATDLDSVTLDVDEDTAEQARKAGLLDLVDPEGAPLARLTPRGRYRARAGRIGLVGPVEPLAHKAFGPFRSLHLAPAAVHATHPRGDLLAVPVRRPMSRDDLERIDTSAGAGARTVLFLVCTGHDMPRQVSGPALVRATAAAAGRL